MSSFQINLITRETLDDKNFLCPNCVFENPFNGKSEKIKNPPRFGGSTASCSFCGDAYLVLDEESIPKHNLAELKRKEPIVILSDTGYIEELLTS